MYSSWPLPASGTAARRILDLHKKHPDWSRSELAKGAKCHKSYVSKILIRYGLSIKNHKFLSIPVPIDQSDVARNAVLDVIDVCPDGMSEAEALAWKLGYERANLYKESTFIRWSDVYKEEIIEDFGYNDEEIAAFEQGFKAARNVYATLGDEIIPEDEEGVAYEGRRLGENDSTKFFSRTSEEVERIGLLGRGYLPELVSVFVDSYFEAYRIHDKAQVFDTENIVTANEPFDVDEFLKPIYERRGEGRWERYKQGLMEDRD